MNNIEIMFKEMYEYLNDTKNIFGTWNMGGPSKRDNLIGIIKRYEFKIDIDDVFSDFRKYIKENNLEKLKF